MHVHELAALAAPLRDTLHRSGVRSGMIVGVPVSNTHESVAMLLALWSLDVTTWLCPLREPAGRLQQMAKRIDAELLLGLARCDSTDLQAGKQLLRDLRGSQAKTLLNTSGSTGWPKFVLHDLSQHFASAEGVNQAMGFGSEHRWLLSLPLYHVGGLAIVVRALLAEAEVFIPKASAALEDTVVESEITHISVVATQLRRLLAHNEASARLAKMTRVALGGGPVPAWLKERASHLPLLASYGATEMGSMWTAGKVGSGNLLSGRELRIAKDGEVRVRGPMLFRRYFDREMAQVFDEDGFYKTGDLGQLDRQENLHILGRRDNMFISGGENIHPQEIEVALLNHPRVEEAIVVGVANAKWGERPVAFVRMMDFKETCEGDLKEYLKEKLPRFKIPDRFFDWPLEASTGLKPSRALIRQKAEALLS